ncbi:MAG: LCP family protein [Chloroflexota bacterium]
MFGIGRAHRRRGRSGPRGDQILRSAALGLLVYALGLVPFYFLTPVHRSVQDILGGIRPAINDRAFLAPAKSGSPNAVVQQEKKTGADAISVVDTTPVANQAPVPVPTAAVGDSEFAVLLLGYGGSGHDGAYLTDSMMVVIVDPRRKTLTLLSLPRDSWVPLLFNGKTAVYNKVNTAFAFAKDPSLYPDREDRYTGDHGPGNFAMDTTSRLLGIPVTYYFGLDFQGFRDMINAVGGVDVNVPDGFAAQYPANDNPDINASWTTVRFTPGEQHMNGERAIEYARARETIDNTNEGTDFARSRRQRLIMEAFKTRLFQPGGLIHLPQLLSIASQHVDTDYSVPDVAQLSQLVLGWKDVKIYQTALTTGNYLEDSTGPDGAYITVPNDPDHSWAQIRAFARRLWANPSVGVAMASTTIVVENDTGVSGVAGRVSDALIGMGYNVADPISGPVRDQTQIVDHTAGSSALISQLEKDVGVGGATVSSSPSADGTSELVLQLGVDQANLTVSVPRDPAAPVSDVGVVKFGVWPYVPATPTQTRAPRVEPSRLAATPTPTPPRGAERATATPPPKGADTVVVPSLIGLGEAEAAQIIQMDGLATSSINYQTISDVADHHYFLSVAPGHVLSQYPRPGLPVPRGTSVLLAVRKQ